MNRHPRSDASLPAAAVLGGSAAFLTIYVAGSVVSFGVHLLVARHFGATGYGHFAYAASWMAILLLGCNLGLKPTVVRFAAQYAAQGEWHMLHGLLRTAIRWTVVASVVVLCASCVTLAIVRPRLDELGWTLLLVGAAMPFMALGDLFSSATRGLGAVTRSQLPSSVGQHAVFALLLSGAIALGYAREGGSIPAAAFLAATFTTMAVSAWILRIELATRGKPPPAAYAYAPWRDAAAANALIALFQAVRAPAIVVVLAAHVPPEHVAYFVAAQRLAGMASLGLIGVSGFVSPLVSRHFVLGDSRVLQRLAHLGARGSIAAAGAVALVLMVLGETVLEWFGPAFGASYVALLVLLTGEIFAAAVGPVGHFLVMTGAQRAASWIEAISGIGALALACALIPAHGMLGAAIAIASGSVLRNLWMAFFLWQRQGIRCCPL